MSERDLVRAISETLIEKDLETSSSEDGNLRNLPSPDSVHERLIMYHKPRSLQAEYFRYI